MKLPPVLLLCLVAVAFVSVGATGVEKRKHFGSFANALGDLYDGEDSLTSSNGREADGAGDAASDRSSDSDTGDEYAYAYENDASDDVSSSTGKRMGRRKHISKNQGDHGSEGSRAHAYGYENSASSPSESDAAIADNAEQDSGSYDETKDDSDVGSRVGSGSIGSDTSAGSVDSPDSDSASYALGKYLYGSGSGSDMSSAVGLPSQLGSGSGSGSVADAGYKTAEEADESDEDYDHSRAGSSDTGSGDSGEAYSGATNSEDDSMTQSMAAYRSSGSGSGVVAEAYEDSVSSSTAAEAQSASGSGVSAAAEDDSESISASTANSGSGSGHYGSYPGSGSGSIDSDDVDSDLSATTSEGAYAHSASGSGYPSGSDAKYYNAGSSDEGAGIMHETSGSGIGGDGDESTYEHLYGYVHDGDEDLTSSAAEAMDYAGYIDGSYSTEYQTAHDYYDEKTDIEYQVAQDVYELDAEQEVGSGATDIDEVTNEYDTSVQGSAYADQSYAEGEAYEGKYQGSTMYDDKNDFLASAMGSIDDAFEAGQADYMSHEGSAYGTKEDDYYQKTGDYVIGDYQASDQDYIENKLYGEEYDAYYGEEKMSSYAQGLVDYVASYIGALEDSLEAQKDDDSTEYGSVASAMGSADSAINDRMSTLYGDASDQGSSAGGEMFLAMNSRAKSKIRRKSPKFYKLLAEMRKARN